MTLINKYLMPVYQAICQTLKAQRKLIVYFPKTQPTMLCMYYFPLFSIVNMISFIICIYKASHVDFQIYSDMINTSSPSLKSDVDLFHWSILDDIPCHFVSAVMAGFCATLMSSPMDVVKTRFINSTPGQYKSAHKCAMTMLVNEGPSAFFKG